ncbi:MAG: hypothetical protein WD468_00055, partial [Pirellulales bacterium]
GDADSDVVWGGHEAPQLVFVTFALWSVAANFTKPPRWDAAEMDYPTGFSPPLITPAELFGTSVQGIQADGMDTVRGGSGNDWLWGGGNEDFLDGGSGNDYMDAGADNDELQGSSGDDVILGGHNDDVVEGGLGIDQLYGDDGTDVIFGHGDDLLFGDAGTGAVQQGQRLWGGGGRDKLFAFAPTIDIATELDLAGDQLFGNQDGDFLYGNLRADTLVGGTGGDYLHGEELRGPTYAINTMAAIIGSADFLYGDSGEDQLFGGGGDDTMFGGGDSDRIEGLNGFDQLYGGGGIDVLVLDVDLVNYNRLGDAFDGHFGNTEANDTFDDNATDILLVKGSDLGDTISLGESEVALVGTVNAPADGRLSGDATFTLSVEGIGTAAVVVPAASTSLNGTIDHLIVDVNNVLAGTIFAGQVTARRVGRKVSLVTVGLSRDTEMELTLANPVTVGELGFFSAQEAVALLTVNYNGADIFANWRNTGGVPVVEQFRIAGLGGPDTIEFVTGPDAVDVAPLTNRSDDWVGVFDGGPGHDTLRGGGARDRLDGGEGNDDAYGFAGDDRLWGGTGDDRLYGGQGHDDLLGQEGDNELYAWSIDPDPGVDVFNDGPSAEFGVFVDADCAAALTCDTLYQDAGDANDNGILDVTEGLPVEQQLPARVLEDTGLNRMLGDRGDDFLFAGPGVDFMYGDGGDDTLFRVDGTKFEDGDGGLVGDAWKEFAKENDKVWYYGATNADDVISVDFVTEPGLLADRHLITRLTNNDGNFTFAAQIRLDFNARDENDNLIWDPEDVVLDIDALDSADPVVRAQALRRFELGTILPPEGDFLVILIDALAGNDQLTVGPTVQATVWADMGLGDDRAEILSGSAILPDRSETRSRNDSADSAFALLAPAVLLGTADAPAGGQLSADAHFSLTIAGSLTVELTVPAAVTNGGDGTTPNASLADLVADLNESIEDEGLEDKIVALAVGNRIAISTRGTGAAAQLAISAAAGDSAVTELRLPATVSVAGSSNIAAGVKYTGLTIDNPADQDWYQFQLAAPGGQLSLGSLSQNDGLTIDLYQATDGDPMLLATGVAPLAVNADQLDSQGSNQTADTATLIEGIADVAIVRGLSLHNAGDTDWFRFKVSYDKPAELVSTAAGPANGQLSAIAHFSLSIGSAAPVDVFVAPDLTNSSLDHLVADINTALTAAGIGPLVEADRSVSRIVLRLRQQGSPDSLAIHIPAGDPAITQLRFAHGQIGYPPGSLVVKQIDGMGALMLEIYTPATTPMGMPTLIPGIVSASGDILTANLAGLPVGEYLAKISGISAARYELRPLIGERGQTVIDFSGQGFASINLAGLSASTTYLVKIASANLIPTTYDLTFAVGGAVTPVSMAARPSLVRRDILIGNYGNDVLSGGPAEDWIFGGPSGACDPLQPDYDVLTGGLDRQAPDLLFGGACDDVFQLLPDALPFIKGTNETLIPTFVDDMFGGEGDDQVLFLGGDRDSLGRVVPDEVAIKYNTILHRYEFTSLIWDMNNQRFTVDRDLLFGMSEPPAFELSGDATFTLVVDGVQQVPIVLAKAGTTGNTAIDHLVADFNTALSDAFALAGLPLSVEAGREGFKLALRRISPPRNASLDIIVPNEVTQRELSFVDTTLAHSLNRRYEQNYIFYQARDIERTVIDTRAGNDVVHGSPEYKFPNYDSEWGIASGDFEQRGLISALDIRGGEGADQLYGGALADRIDGGAHNDFVFGGEGNDELHGGSGDDLIVGDDDVRPDRFESVSRGNEADTNDNVNFAALIDYAGPGTVFRDLSLHLGDEGDWYAVRTPEAFRRFGATQSALVTREMIHVTFDIPTEDILFHDPAYAGRNVLLFAAQNTAAPGEPLHVLPVEQFSGVPEFYLIHIVNVNRLVGTEDVDQGMGTYTLGFTTPPIAPSEPIVGATIDIPATVADVHTNSTDLADRAVSIPLGDINDDGYDDFIAAIREDLGRLEDFNNLTAGEHPAERLGPTLARVYFGSATPADAMFDANNPDQVVLKLPAPLTSASIWGAQSQITSVGDINADGLPDLAVAVSLTWQGGQAPFLVQNYDIEGVYVLFGRDTWLGTVDVITEADVVIRGFTGDLSVTGAGDVNGDGIDDLLVGDDQTVDAVGEAFLYYGRTDWLTAAPVYSTDATDDDTINFENIAQLPGYVNGLWHATERRGTDGGHSPLGSFYYGREVEGNYNVGASAGRVVTPPIDFTGIGGGQISFSYFLQTENSDYYDSARLLYAVDFGGGFEAYHQLSLPTLNNGTGGRLIDPSGGWQTVTADLTSLLDANEAQAIIKFAFEFDTKDTLYNHFEGFYVDDIAVKMFLGVDNADVKFRINGAFDNGLGSSVAGIGDVNGDGQDDFAIAAADFSPNQGRVFVYYGREACDSCLQLPEEVDPQAAPAAFGADQKINPGISLDDHVLYAAGDVTGDALDDFLISGFTQSFLVAGPALPANVHAGPRLLVPLGNFDGVGPNDLGASFLEPSPTLAEDGSQLVHQVGHVFLGEMGTPDFSRVDLVIEPGRPSYQIQGNATARASLYASAGDLDQNGLDDLAIADSFGSRTNILLGRSLVSTVAATVTTQPVGQFRFALATPSITATTGTPSGTNLGGLGGTATLNDTFRLHGAAAEDALSRLQRIGDFNDDGIDDFILESEEESYVLFGPVEVTGTHDIESRAALVLSSRSIGQPAERMGDINGDGVADIVMVRANEIGSNYVVSILYGGVDLYPGFDEETRVLYVDHVDVSFTIGGSSFGGDLTVHALNFNGDKFDDLLTIWSQSEFIAVDNENVHGWIFSGAAVSASGPVFPVTPTNPRAASLARIIADGTSVATLTDTVVGPGWTFDPSHGEELITTVAGDINGDGLDDLLMANPAFADFDYFFSDLPRYGRAYVLLGRADSALPILRRFVMGEPNITNFFTTNIDILIEDWGIGGGVAAVGDLNRDGY